MKPKIYKPPICMTKEFWLNSHFSVVKYCGHMRLNGNEYLVVNRLGTPYWGQLIDGEPADLVIVDWLPVYRKVGRERFLEIAKQTNDLTLAKEMAGMTKKKKQ